MLKQQVEVIDLKLNTTTTYHAIRATAKVLGIDKRYINNYFNLNQTEPVLGRYIFRKTGKPAKVNMVTQRTCQAIEVTDLQRNKSDTYLSESSAARALGVHPDSISLYLKENPKNPFKGRYVFRLFIRI